MYLHIGEARIVFLEDIIGIFNLNIKNKEENTQFFALSREGNEKEENSRENKSFIVTKDNVYYSPISSQTLAKRKEK